MANDVGLANLSCAIYKQNLLRLRPQMFFDSFFNFSIKHTLFSADEMTFQSRFANFL